VIALVGLDSFMSDIDLNWCS